MGSVDDNPLSAVVLAHLDAAVIAVDNRFLITIWNHAAEELYGWPASEVLGKPIDAVVPVVRYLAGQSPSQVRATLFTTGSWRGEVVQPHQDGHHLVLETSMRLVRDGAGAPQTIIALNQPGRAVKQSQAALRTSAEYWRTLVDHAAGILIVLDDDGVIRHASPGLSAMLGYTSDEWTGRPALDLVYPDDRPAALGFFERVVHEPHQVQTRELGLGHQ